jgi:hypothetical protein
MINNPTDNAIIYRHLKAAAACITAATGREVEFMSAHLCDGEKHHCGTAPARFDTELYPEWPGGCVFLNNTFHTTEGGVYPKPQPERWLPGHGETYWSVDCLDNQWVTAQQEWGDTWHDWARYDQGRVFYTRELAIIDRNRRAEAGIPE